MLCRGSDVEITQEESLVQEEVAITMTLPKPDINPPVLEQTNDDTF